MAPVPPIPSGADVDHTPSSGARRSERPTAVVIANPRARRAGALSHAAIVDALAGRWAARVVAPTSAEATTAEARAAAAAGAGAVFAAGGDGTVRLVAQALAGTGVPLGILPLGTANDLSRALGLPRTPAEALRQLTHATPRPTAVVECNGGLVLTCVGGLGIASRAALAVPRLRAGSAAARTLAAVTGTLVYKLAAVAELLAHGGETRQLAVSWLTPEGVRHDDTVEAHGAFVALQRYTGGGLRLPAGGRDDGAFELLIVRRTSRARLLDAFTRLSLGLAIPPQVMRVIAAREAHVVTSTPDTLFGDGDRLVDGSVFHLRARSDALRVLR